MRTIISRASEHKPAQPVSVADASLQAFIGTPDQRARLAKRSKPSAGANRKDHIADVQRRWRENDWKGMTPGYLVALYWVCHVAVYGTEPLELDKATVWTQAMKSAGALVKKHFDGDVDLAVCFMRWVWTRERDREDWRRRNNVSSNRITWVRQFCYETLVSDWRTEKVRQRA